MRNIADKRSVALAVMLLLAGCGLYLVIFAIQIDRNPLRADEVDYFQCMRNLTVLGKPLYYAGETERSPDAVLLLSREVLAGRSFDFYRFRPETGILKQTYFAISDGDSRYTWCMWHPPLYVYLGGLFLRLFDPAVAQPALLRTMNLVYVLGILTGMGFLLRELYRPGWLLGLGLASVLFATNSLAVRAGLLIDYNGTLAQCVVAWATWAFLRLDRQPRAMPLAIVLLALTFAVGLGVGVSILLGLLLWTLLFRRGVMLIRHIAAAAGGVLLFIAAFWLFAQVAGLPFSQPFLHNFQRADLQAPLSRRLVAMVRFSGWYARETGLVAIILGLLMGLYRLLHKQADRLLLPVLILVGVLSQAGLSGDAYGFPKYIAFALPLLFALIGGELSMLARVPRWRYAAVALVLTLGLAQAWQSLEILARPGGTLYFRGEQGFRPAAFAAAANTQPGDTLLSSKDLAFYAGRNFVEWYGSSLTDLAVLQRRVENEQVTAVAASRALLSTASPEVTTWVATHSTLILEDGDFQLRRLP